ncbi:MAG: hypothetical protein FWE23_07930 [Chitinivibrionia bacterium]|nr:hypothetical protein [Chitinivibrionia bacterium]
MEKWQEEMAEIRAAMAENMKGFAELRESQKKTDEQMKKTGEEITRLNKTVSGNIDKVGKRIDKLHKTVTGISDNSGFHAEQYFQEALAKSKTFGGEKYDKLIKNLKFQGKESCEFDIFLVNGQSVAIIEAKNRIHPNAVEDVAVRKVAQFRKYFPEYKDYKLRLGIAGFSFDDYVAEEARKYGVGIIRQVGDAIELDDKNLKVY